MMFSKTEIKKPNYAIRMLLSRIYTDKTDNFLVLKEFSHFSLGCTSLNEEQKIKLKFELLADYLKGPLSLTASEVVNLGTEVKPLWGITLNLGDNENDFRRILGVLFDDIMSHQMNGILYLWDGKENQERYCPHITIGPNNDDLITAQKLVEDEYTFHFERMDYKRVGPFDPHVKKDLQNVIEKSNRPGQAFSN